MEDRRKSIIVDKAAQTRMAVAISWPFGVALAVLALLLGIGGGKLAAQTAIEDPHSSSLLAMILITVSVALVTVGFVGWTVIRETHRIVGPTYRVKRTIEQFLAGDESVRARLRRADHMQDLAASVNDLLDRVSLRSEEASASASESVEEEVVSR